MRGLFALRLRRLSSDAELEAFVVGFCEVLAARSRGALRGDIPLEYLRRSQVTAVFDRAGKMVAGYVVGTRTPLRLLEFVPDEARSNLRLPTGATWDDCCELTCMWRTPEVSALGMVTRVWPRALAEAVRTGKSYLLGHSQSARLDSLYGELSSSRVTLYLGPSVAGLPSRLLAYETRQVWHQAARLILSQTVRRLLKRVRRPALTPASRTSLQSKGGSV